MKTILVAEDEYLIALDIEHALQKAGYLVRFANSCDRALDIAAAERVDAAIVDVVLRDRDCDELVAHLSRRHIPFAYYSGLADAPVMKRWPARHLNKPSDASQLVAAISDLASPTGIGDARNLATTR